MQKLLLGMMALAAIAGGCADKQQANRMPLRPSSLDVAPAPVYTNVSQPIQPIAVVQPVEQQPASPASFNATAAAGSTYTVQKGDTLYKIARERYGDGKQWQKIASANPGLSPTTLKVGQKIAIP